MLNCPRCKSGEVQRTPVNASDFYYLLLLQRPYLCHACGNRFFRASWVGAAFLRAAFAERDEDAATAQDVHSFAKSYAVNRRGWVRFFCDFDASCEAPATSSEGQLPGRVNDISRGGALLLFDRSIAEGTPLQLVLENAPDQAPWLLNGHVAHCHPHGDHEWAVGCRFDQRLSCEDLENLLTSGQASSEATLAGGNSAWKDED